MSIREDNARRRDDCGGRINWVYARGDERDWKKWILSLVGGGVGLVVRGLGGCFSDWGYCS